MGIQAFTILGLSVVATALTTGLRPFRGWLRGFALAPFGAFLLVLLFIGTLFLGGVREQGGQLLDPLRLVRVALFVAITTLAWVDLLLNKNIKAPINAVLWIMFAYGVFALGTVVYSLNPMLTLWKAFEVITHVSIIAVLSRYIGSVEDALSFLGIFWIFLLFVGISLIFSALIAPEAAIYVTMKGATILRGVAFTVNPNTATQVGVILSLTALSLLITPPAQSNRLAVILLLALSGTVILLSHSRTSIFAAAVALIITAWVARKVWLIFLILFFSIIVLISEYAAEEITTYILRGQTEEQFIGMTGRVYFWKIAWRAFAEQPVFGYGFYSGTRVLFDISGVDNTYLQVLLGGGIVLLAIFLPAIIVVGIQLLRTWPPVWMLQSHRDYFLLWIQTTCLFTVLIIRSTTGPSFDAHHVNLFLFLACSVTASALVRFKPAYVENTNTSIPAHELRAQRPAVSTARYHAEIESVRPNHR